MNTPINHTDTSSKKDTIVLINELGVITGDHVIIYKGKQSSVIYLKNIKKIHLIKKRVFYTNVLFFSITLSIIYMFIYSINLHYLTKYGIILFSIITTLLSVFHKFYIYSIIIYLQNNELFVLKTNQLRKEQAKKFYNSIKKISKQREISRSI